MSRAVVRLDLARREDLERWQGYVLARPDSRYGDLGQWRRVFRELYGLESVDLACVEGGRTLGVASVYLVASPFFGRLLVTCPFFGYGGLYADDPASESALLDAIHGAAVDLDVDFVELRLNRPIEAGYRIGEDFLEFELCLPSSAEEAWRGSLSSNARQNVRRSEREGLVFGTTRDPAEAFALVSRAQRDLGTPFHPRRLFDLMAEHLPGHVEFSTVRQGARLLGAGVLVRHRDRLATPYIGSLVGDRATRANYCQYWGIVRHCLDLGIRTFDLGRSPRGSSHQRFKEKWGAVPVPVYYCHRAISNRRTYRTALEASRLERAVSAVWKRLPLALTRRIGHRAARYIP